MENVQIRRSTSVVNFSSKELLICTLSCTYISSYKPDTFCLQCGNTSAPKDFCPLPQSRPHLIPSAVQWLISLPKNCSCALCHAYFELQARHVLPSVWKHFSTQRRLPAASVSPHLIPSVSPHLIPSVRALRAQVPPNKTGIWRSPRPPSPWLESNVNSDSIY